MSFNQIPIFDISEILEIENEKLNKKARQEYLEKRLKEKEEGGGLLNPRVTDARIKAPFSHTSAIASDIKIWNSMFKQTSAISVNSLQELADLTLAFSKSDHLPQSKRIAIMSFSTIAFLL